MAASKPILLVEDNLNDIELTTRVLKTNRVTNEVIVMRHGGEALDYLYRRGGFKNRPHGNPAVILLDLKMPKVDGLEVLRTIKSDDSLKIIPVVVFTSSREETDLVKSYHLGVNAYVVKPVGFEQFTDAIKQMGTFWVTLNESPANGITLT